MSEKSKGIFYGIVAIATLIVAIVGATLAYFSVFASSPENAVGLKSKIINIVYADGQNIILPEELIPSAYDYVVTSYESPTENRERCIDDNGYEICAVYEFSIENSADDIDLEMYLNIGLNEFTNLRYMLYEVDGNSRTNVYRANNIITQRSEFSFEIGTRGVGEKVSLVGYDEEDNRVVKYSMPSDTEKTFELVIYLQENDEPQDDEQGRSFAGTIEIKAGGRITGYISD